ncbi:SMR family transporter [Zunongwangia sp. HRR-M8]|uniref:SMR family transporter n=1 Tax=Zunongwangia sp. HRR-M8 TaxID=3015170 RepID=UPI003FCD3B92
MSLLLKVTKVLFIITSYAVWTGIGAAGTLLLGLFIFKKTVTFSGFFLLPKYWLYHWFKVSLKLKM